MGRKAKKGGLPDLDDYPDPNAAEEAPPACESAVEQALPAAAVKASKKKAKKGGKGAAAGWADGARMRAPCSPSAAAAAGVP